MSNDITEGEEAVLFVGLVYHVVASGSGSGSGSARSENLFK